MSIFKYYYSANNILIEGHNDLGLQPVISNILKEKRRRMLFVDGWNNTLQDILHDGDVFENNPYNFIIFAIIKGDVSICFK